MSFPTQQNLVNRKPPNTIKYRVVLAADWGLITPHASPKKHGRDCRLLGC